MLQCIQLLLVFGGNHHLSWRRRKSSNAAMISREDAESNARLVQALFENPLDEIDMDDKEIASHLKLERDEDGQPLQLRFVYVDEVDW